MKTKRNFFDQQCVLIIARILKRIYLKIVPSFFLKAKIVSKSITIIYIQFNSNRTIVQLIHK